MREIMLEVCELQLEHSSENTPAMQRRGELIRNVIPTEFRTWKDAFRESILPYKGRLNVQGRDGTGRKTFVPWVRIHSPELSPSAQNGWYVVYLFHQDGSGISLCLMHGSTKFNGAEFVARPPEEARKLKSWAQHFLHDDASALDFTFGVNLGSVEPLAKAYEKTAAISKYYSSLNMPSDIDILRDLRQALGLLGKIYDAINQGIAPESSSPEIADAEMFINEIAKPERAKTSYGGQGFGLNAEQRRAVELRAMDVAREWLVENGFVSITNTSTDSPYDYTAKKGDSKYIIEVKGTTSILGNIFLTANEVDAHIRHFPKNVLIVVSQIQLLEMRTKALSGLTSAWVGWAPHHDRLKAMCYSYSCHEPPSFP